MYHVHADRTAIVMHLDDVLEGLLYLALESKNQRERVGENIEHGLFDHVVSILSLKANNKTIQRNCI